MSGTLLLFENIDTLKNHAVDTLLKKEQLPIFRQEDVLGNIKHLKNLCYPSSDWGPTDMVMLSPRPGTIELRDGEDISELKARFCLIRKGQWNYFSKVRIFPNGRYLLAETTQEKVWLIDMVNHRAERIVSNDRIELVKHEWSKVRLQDRLKISADTRFGIVTQQNKNPILFDLKSKVKVEIKVGSPEEIAGTCRVLSHSPWYFNAAGSRSAYLTAHNELLCYVLDRRVRIVYLKSYLENKSLRELVEPIVSNLVGKN
jgi:hypothetical protein